MGGRPAVPQIPTDRVVDRAPAITELLKGFSRAPRIGKQFAWNIHSHIVTSATTI
jgi:hypothetical protein